MVSFRMSMTLKHKEDKCGPLHRPIFANVIEPKDRFRRYGHGARACARSSPSTGFQRYRLPDGRLPRQYSFHSSLRWDSCGGTGGAPVVHVSESSRLSIQGLSLIHISEPTRL